MYHYEHHEATPAFGGSSVPPADIGDRDRLFPSCDVEKARVGWQSGQKQI